MRISDWSSDVCSSGLLKPLVNHRKGLSSFAGATILGDGSVALILDVMGLAQRAHVINESRDRSMLAANAEHDAASLDTTPALLLETVDEIGRASCRERVRQYV